MSGASRRRSREEYQKWLAWYNTLSDEDKQKEDSRIESQQLKGFLYIMLGLIVFVGLSLLSQYIGDTWLRLQH